MYSKKNIDPELAYFCCCIPGMHLKCVKTLSSCAVENLQRFNKNRHKSSHYAVQEDVYTNPRNKPKVNHVILLYAIGGSNKLGLQQYVEV